MNQAEDSEIQMKFTTTIDLHPAPPGMRSNTVNDALENLDMYYFSGSVFYTDPNSIRIILRSNERDGLVEFVGMIKGAGYRFTNSINKINKKMKATVKFPRPSKKILDEWEKSDRILYAEIETENGCLSSGSGDSSSLDDAATLHHREVLKEARKYKKKFIRDCKELETKIRDICKSLNYEKSKTESIFNSMNWSLMESPDEYSDELKKALEKLQAKASLQSIGINGN